MTLAKKWLFRVVLAIVFLVALVAATENSQPVALTFLGYKTPTIPVSWWVLAAFVLGVIFGVVINFFTNAKLRMAARKANRSVDKANKELDKAKASKVPKPAPPATDG